MGKHLSAIQICIGPPIYRNRAGQQRVPYMLKQYGEILKSGSGWGDNGAWAAANKALKRLAAKGVK